MAGGVVRVCLLASLVLYSLIILWSLTERVRERERETERQRE